MYLIMLLETFFRILYYTNLYFFQSNHRESQTKEIVGCLVYKHALYEVKTFMYSSKLKEAQ